MINSRQTILFSEPVAHRVVPSTLALKSGFIWRLLRGSLVAIALASFPAELNAGESKNMIPLPPHDTQSPWQFWVAPYAWGTFASGTVGLDGILEGVDVSPGDAISRMEFAQMLSAGITYKKWSLDSDFIHARFSSSDSLEAPTSGNLNSTLEQFLWTSKLGYRVLEGGAYSLDLQAGLRLISLGSTFDVNGGLLDGTSGEFNRTWVDPLLGANFTMYPTRWLYLIAMGDVGGFGANSRLTWQAFVGAGFQYARWGSVIVGYRGLGYDYDQAAFTYQVTTHGPILGLVFNF